jgi:hypothetical protein
MRISQAKELLLDAPLESVPLGATKEDNIFGNFQVEGQRTHV